MYRYADPGVAVLDPSESVAMTFSGPPPAGPGGVVNVNESGVTLLSVSGMPPMVAVVGFAKSEPDTSTLSPPPAGPEAGVSAETVGNANVYRAMYVFQQLFAFVQPVPVSPSLSSDTAHTSVGCDGSCTAAE